MAVGTALLMFGICWLRKAIPRSAGVIGHHDESAIYTKEARTLQTPGTAARRWDPVATLTAYKAVLLEGVEIVVIVIGVGTVGDMLLKGIGIQWPYRDAAIPCPVAVLFVASLVAVRSSRYVRTVVDAGGKPRS